MRPERTRDQLKSVGIARARMFLKGHLEWLDGVPVSQSVGRIEWRTRPRVGTSSGTTMNVDRELLRQSHACLNKLVHHFPQALPKLVGDVPAWQRNTTAMLDRLKASVHDGSDIVDAAAMPIESLSKSERLLVDQLSRRHPPFVPLLRFVIWSGWTWQAPRTFLLPWIDENADWIDQHLQVTGAESGLINVLLAADLVRTDGDESLQFLRSALGDAACFHVSTNGLRPEIEAFLKGLRGWRNPKSPPRRPRPTTADAYGPQVVDFLHWLSNQEPSIRQRAVRLTVQVLSHELAQSWQAGWDNLQTAAHKAIRSLCQTAKQIHCSGFHAEACRVTDECEQELKNEPLRYPVGEPLAWVKELAAEKSAPFLQALGCWLATIPVRQADGSPDREGWALRLATLREARNAGSDQDGIRYYELSRRFLIANSDKPYRLRPWAGLVTSWNDKTHARWSPRSTLFDDLPRSQWADFFDVLHRLAGQNSYSVQRNGAIARLLMVSTGVGQTCERFLQLAPEGLLEDCSAEQLRTAAGMETTGFTFVEILELVGPSSRIDQTLLPSILALHHKFAAAGWTNLIPSILRTRSTADIERVAAQFQIVNSSGDSLEFLNRVTSETLPAVNGPLSVVSGTEIVPEWARHLPELLQATIATFTVVFPASRGRIERLLEPCFVDTQKLRTEIAVLERRVWQQPTEMKLQRRLDNLMERLNQPRPVSAAELHRTQQKLEDALLWDVFRDSCARIESNLVQFLGGRTGLRDLGKRTISPRHLELVRGIFNLEEPYRAYGLRLLRKRWGNVAWDLEEEPANRRFLDGLKARGVRTESWLNSRVCQVAIEGQPRPWTLAFESNEVEQLLMGYYFDTCLSPNGFNFFSAVANGIDINRRVLYARDWRGQVMGRCLFAIGDAGTIVNYRPYCHDGQTEFELHVARFAAELAADMGTVVSHTDHVSPLVAPKWYDDGAYDLGNSITSDQSHVRAAIQAASEVTLVQALETALGPVGLNESMLELVVGLPEFQTRPHLIRPLLPMIEHHERRLGLSTMIFTAQLAHRTGIQDVAARLTVKYAPDWIRRQANCCSDCFANAVPTLQMLIQYHPSSALRLLRSTRPRSVNGDQDEQDDNRRKMLAECFDALGRTRLAAEMRQRK